MTAPSDTHAATDAGPATGDSSVAVAGVDQPRDPDLILARVHLLLGSLSLARTELETLAGRGTLDDRAIRDLAEARWRTGDVIGAGEAATAWLERNPDDVLGLVIAAEAQAALGRPGEARRLAGRAMERADGSLDPLFAGMQRSAIWPVEPGSTSGPFGVLFDDLHPGPHAVPPLPTAAHGGGLRSLTEEIAGGGSSGPFEPGVPAVLASGPSLWGDDGPGMDAVAGDAFDPTTLFHGARQALEAGRPAEAGTGLILALRAEPGLAPAVLDLLAGRGEPILALVRGDAQRIVGREIEAMRDHATAAGGLAPDDLAPDHEPDADTAAPTVHVDDEPATQSQENS